MREIIFYLIGIVVVNMSFTYLPMIDLPMNQSMPPGTLLVGFIFVLRDYAQRASGRLVYPAMLVGVILSYIMADPFVAVASATAFAISELIDAAVFTYTKRTFRDRILLSSAISTPVDSAVFLLMLGFFDWIGFVLMILVKMIGAVAVWKIAGKE